jgi:cytochrome P450
LDEWTDGKTYRETTMSERKDVVEIGLGDMSPQLRALIAYEPNGSFNTESPQPILDEILCASPVVRWELGVGFFNMADVRAACQNPDIVSLNPATGLNFGMGSQEPLIPLHLEGKRHLHFRKLLAPLFTARKMAKLDAKIRALADELIDGFIGAGHVELHAEFCKPLASILFLRLFGLPLDLMDTLIGMKDTILKNDGTDRNEQERIGLAEGEKLRKLLRAQLDARHADGGRYDDLLDEFIHFELDGERLTDDEVENIMHMFTVAGLDTVTSSLSCLFAWLATHQEDRDRLVADPARLPKAIEELLRFESPVPSGGARWAARDTEINGVPVKKGELIYLCWASANLDPATFDEPLIPKLDRRHTPHVAFAVGTHHCLGSHLARTELRVAIDQFHRRITNYRVADGEEIEYEFAGVRQAKRLPLAFTAS